MADVMELVDRAVALEKSIKEDKKELDSVKATLTKIAYEDMENKNLKFKQLFGYEGIFNAVYKEKFEVDNYYLLKELVGDLAEDKVKRTEEIKYEIEDKFKKALIVLFKGEFMKEPTVEQVLIGMGLDSEAVKTARKKLKGEYLKDKKVLETLGVQGTCEEELDAIRLYKNHELVARYFGDPEKVDVEKLRKAVWVEDSLSVGVEYNKD
jgi:hypothetical protein